MNKARRHRLPMRGLGPALALLALGVGGGLHLLGGVTSVTERLPAQLAPVGASLQQAADSVGRFAAMTLPDVDARAPDTVHLAGPVEVVDGDSLRVGQERVRLFGLDAPEYRQTCRAVDGTMLAIGASSAAALRELADGRSAECEVFATDRYARRVARCTVSGMDVGEAQVRAGHALAYRRYSESYIPHEAQAKDRGLGLWRCSEPVDPEAHRRAKGGA